MKGAIYLNNLNDHLNLRQKVSTRGYGLFQVERLHIQQLYCKVTTTVQALHQNFHQTEGLFTENVLCWASIATNPAGYIIESSN